MNQLQSQEHIVLASSPDPENIYTGSPSIARLSSGRLIVSYEWFRPKPFKESVPNSTEILVSDDNGHTWEMISCQDFIWATIWTYENYA